MAGSGLVTDMNHGDGAAGVKQAKRVGADVAHLPSANPIGGHDLRRLWGAQAEGAITENDGRLALVIDLDAENLGIRPAFEEAWPLLPGLAVNLQRERAHAARLRAP